MKVLTLHTSNARVLASLEDMQLPELLTSCFRSFCLEMQSCLLNSIETFRGATEPFQPDLPL